MAPKHVAPAALFRDSQQLAFGVLTSLTVTGACIVTESRLGPGRDVDLKLSFYRQPCLYELAASVVWNRRGGAGENGFEGLQLHGVRFMLSSALQKSRLHALLAGENFVDVFRPSVTEFDLLLNALAVRAVVPESRPDKSLPTCPREQQPSSSCKRRSFSLICKEQK